MENNPHPLKEAHCLANLCQRWEELKTERHYSGNLAAKSLGKSPAWFSVNYPRWKREGLAAFVPKCREPGAGRQLFKDLPPWFMAVARFYYLNTNLTTARGSIPEAIRCVISLPACPNVLKVRLLRICQENGHTGAELPECPESLREAILARQKLGKPLLPASITAKIAAPETVIRQLRSPRNASLDFISASGTQMWIRDEQSGEKYFIRGGDMWEADDATINFPCVVPWPMRGCPCSEKFEVKVARFQWLVAMDVGSRKVVGYSYTARPKSSYRGEDILAMMRGCLRAHGIPRFWRLEKGAWASNLVANAVATLGSHRIEVHSPHAKPFIEGLFNKFWTKLSYRFPSAQVGRYLGDNQEAARLLTACQAGQRDPRHYFPPLADVLEAFDVVISEHNESPIRSANYGRWIPNERWAADTAARPLRPLDRNHDWIFSPFVREWKVKGNSVSGRVPIMPGLSVPYDFQAPELLPFHGAIIRAYFDPNEPRCAAKICLAESWPGHRAGDAICDAIQTNETTSYVRLVLGFGDDGTLNGLEQRRKAHAALRREVRAINGGGFKASEQRNGTGNAIKIEKFEAPKSQPEQAKTVHADPAPQIQSDLAAIRQIERDNPQLFF